VGVWLREGLKPPLNGFVLKSNQGVNTPAGNLPFCGPEVQRGWLNLEPT
jgi:hypothetical protein